MINVVIYDTTFIVNRGELPNKWEIQGNEHYENFKAALRFLSSIGFYVSEDKDIKRKYPKLNDKHKIGRYADLKFKAEWHSNDFKITFFQDVYHENPCGGFYDFNKLEKMPYLIKKQYELTQHKLIAYFENKGYKVSFGKNTKSGAEFIVEDYIRSWHHPQNKIFELSEINGETPEQGYNATDRDKKIIHNGETKYFRGFDGYLRRGIVYHNINNMWWILTGGEIRNICCSDLFDLSDNECRGRKKRHAPPPKYVERKKQLSLCSTAELKRELKRRESKQKGGVK